MFTGLVARDEAGCEAWIVFEAERGRDREYECEQEQEHEHEYEYEYEYEGEGELGGGAGGGVGALEGEQDRAMAFIEFAERAIARRREFRRRPWFHGIVHSMITFRSCITLLCFLNSIASVVIAQEAGPVRQTDDWVYLENEDLRVGLLRSHGGAIAHLSSRGSDFNTLNHYDHGRLVQQSYYGDDDGSRWVDQPWRYNPVQGGDYHGNAAVVVELESTEKTAYVRTIPRHWASGELAADCTMEQWLELDGPVLRVRYRFGYTGKTVHQPRHQETPAVFVSPGLSTLVTYSGDKPWTSGPLERRKPGWPNESVALPEGWAAYVGEDGKGIGVYVPGSTEATCYRFEGGAGSDCSYIAPLHTFALKPGLSFSYTAFFTLGHADTIRERFAGLHEAGK